MENLNVEDALYLEAAKLAALSVPNKDGKIASSIYCKPINFPYRFIYGFTFEHLDKDKHYHLSEDFIKQLEELGNKFGLKLCSILEDNNVRD